MKKIKKSLQLSVASLLVAVSLLSGSLAVNAAEDIMEITAAEGYTVAESYRPKASIVIDSQTGKVIWDDNSDEQMSIASLSKVMTAYLAFEAMEQGKYTLETVLQPSETIINISQIYSLSNNKMMAGVDYTVSDLMYLIFMPSSNAATVMLANHTSDNDEAAFINSMNAKAKELGMSNTVYYNATGATSSSFLGYYNPVGIDPDGENISTARDLSILIYNLLKKYPQVLEFTKNATHTVHPGQISEETFESYLFALPGKKYAYEGFDGIKTGSSPSAGFGFVGTAKREDTRLIEVILGVGDWTDQAGEEERHPTGNALLDRGFAGYEYKKILDKGEQVINDQKITLEADFYDFVPKDKEVTYELIDNKLAVVSDLPQVSDKIAENTIPFKGKVTNKDKEKEPESAAKPGKGSKNKNYLVPILLTILGIALSVIATFVKPPRQGRRHSGGSSLGNMLLILGLLVVITGIGLGIAINLNLLSL